MDHLSFLNNIATYDPNVHLVSKDLKIETKKSVYDKGIFQKISDWYRGTYNAKKTAAAINDQMKMLLESGRFSPTEEQLRPALAKLRDLNTKFSERKGIKSLEDTIRIVEQALKKIQEKQALKESKIPTPLSPAGTSPKKQSSPQSSPPTSTKHRENPPNIPTTKSPPKGEGKALSPHKPSPNIPTSTKVKEPPPAVAKSPTQMDQKKIPPPVSQETVTSQVQTPKPLSKSDAQLQSIQAQINKLNPNSPDFKKDLKKIRLDLQRFTLAYPTYKEHFLPLIEIIKTLERKGVFAFKPSNIQQKLLDQYNPHQDYSKDSFKKPLVAFIDFLKTDSASPPKSIAEQLISKSSAIMGTWSRLETNFFLEQLNLSPEQKNLENNIRSIMKVLTETREKLSQDYQQFLSNFMESYPSEEFRKLISNYPNDNLELSQQDVLDVLIDQLMLGMIGNQDLKTKIGSNIWKERGESGYTNLQKSLIEIFVDNVEKYDWFKKNINKIRIPYDQGADHNRNQVLGTCYQNCLRRHFELSTSGDLPTEEIGMGSELKDRMIKAKVTLGEKANLAETLKEYGIDSTNVKINSYDFKVKKSGRKETKTDNDYHALVNSLIQPSTKEQNSLLGILATYSTSPEGNVEGHAINIQVDPAKKRFRIIDDNIGLIEFSSLKELKEEFASYLRIFYPDYSQFKMLIPL